MKKNSSIFILTIILCCLGLTISSCKIKVERDDKKTAKMDMTADAVRENINELADTSWDKSNYTAILDDQIPTLKDEDSRESCTKKLNDAYAAVMVKEGNELMDNNGCSPNHNRLNALMTELNQEPFKTAEGAKELISRYSTHKNALNYAKNIQTSCVAKRWTDNYNPSYETTVRNQAKAHIAANPNCNGIKNALSETELKRKFAKRRANFCNSLVKRFHESSDRTSQAKAQQLERNIRGIQGSCPTATRNLIEKYVKEVQL